jgi:sulfur-carrier protein
MKEEDKMATIRIPTPLRTYTEDLNEVSVKGDTVAEIMADLIEQYPSLKPHLFKGNNKLRPFVNLYLNDENIKDLDGMDTRVTENDRLLLLPSIAGGVGCEVSLI